MQVQPNTQPAPDEAAEQQPEQPEQQGSGIDPKQLAARRLAMRVMTKLYSSKEMTDHVVAAVANADNPAQGLAQATMYAMDGLRSSAQGQAASDLIDMATPLVALYVGELAAKAGAAPDDRAVLKQAIDIIIQQRQGGAEQQQGAQPPGQPPAGQEQPEQPEGLINSAVA